MWHSILSRLCFTTWHFLTGRFPTPLDILYLVVLIYLLCAVGFALPRVILFIVAFATPRDILYLVVFALPRDILYLVVLALPLDILHLVVFTTM